MLELLAKLGFSETHPGVVCLLLAIGGHTPADIRARTGRWGFVLELAAALSTAFAPATNDDLVNWFLALSGRLKIGAIGADESALMADNFVFAFIGRPRFLFDDNLQRALMRQCEWLSQATPAKISALIEKQEREAERIIVYVNRMLGRQHFAVLAGADDLRALGFVGAAQVKALPGAAAVKLRAG